MSRRQYVGRVLCYHVKNASKEEKACFTAVIYKYTDGKKQGIPMIPMT